jgi:hypothetical protein
MPTAAAGSLMHANCTGIQPMMTDKQTKNQSARPTSHSSSSAALLPAKRPLLLAAAVDASIVTPLLAMLLLRATA